MSSTNNVKIPPMLPTQPLPINVVTGNVMYMYSCSQCDFKTHVESLFKQHVDSVHLGIPNVPSNLILGQSHTAGPTTVVATAANVISVPQTIVMAAAQAATSPSAHQHLVNVKPEPGIVNVKTEPNLNPVNTVSSVITQQQQTNIVAQDKLHKCPKCNVLLPSKYQLTQHKRKVHGKAAVAIAAAAAAAAIPNPGLTTYVVSSQANQVVASLVQSVAATQSQNPVVVSNNPPPSAASAAALAAVAAASGSSNSVITSVGTTGTNLTGKKTYSCTACGYSTTRRDGLSQHYDSVHLKIKNHQCELCPYAASQKGTLNRHVKLRHKKKEVLS